MNSTANLKRQIGFRTAVALIVGEVIAVGIFLTPSGMAKAIGSPFLLLFVCRLVGGFAWRVGRKGSRRGWPVRVPSGSLWASRRISLRMDVNASDGSGSNS